MKIQLHHYLFIKFPYTKSGANVFVNGKPAIVVGDKTECGDEALIGSSNVFINGKAVHRKDDATKGHDAKFLPSKCRNRFRKCICKW